MENDDPLAGSLRENVAFLNGGLPPTFDPASPQRPWKNYTAEYKLPLPPWPEGLEPPVVPGVAFFVEEIDDGK